MNCSRTAGRRRRRVFRVTGTTVIAGDGGSVGGGRARSQVMGCCTTSSGSVSMRGQPQRPADSSTQAAWSSELPGPDSKRGGPKKLRVPGWPAWQNPCALSAPLALIRASRRAGNKECMRAEQLRLRDRVPDSSQAARRTGTHACTHAHTHTRTHTHMHGLMHALRRGRWGMEWNGLG